MRYPGYYYRNPDDLVFADTAEEALLPREELLRRQRARRHQARSFSRRPKPAPSRPAPRCLSIPPQQVFDQLAPYNSEDVIRRALSQVGDLCPENINAEMYKKFQDRLEDLAQGPRRLRRYNPYYFRNPQESTALLARRALAKLRRQRAKAGFDVFRRNPWSAGDVKRHNKACAGRAACRSKWPEIANAVLRDSGDKGKAIRIANWNTKRMGLYRRNPNNYCPNCTCSACLEQQSFRRNPDPWGGSAWASHMNTPPEALDGPATSLSTSMTEHFLGPM